MLTIKAALQEASSLFSDSESASLDAEILLAFVLGKTREHLFTWPEQELTVAQQETFQRHCQRRAKGHPVAYLTGQRAFWNFELKVNSHVLIPRPETELLVELSLDKLSNEEQCIADLGTGSGAIALVLASERPNWKILACDLSKAALDVARQNAECLSCTTIEFKLGEWCDAFAETELDAIISNPPYIDAQDEHLQQGDVRFEPALALISAEQGLADIKIIASQAQEKLKSGGWLLLEHGFQQGESVRQILHDQSFSDIVTHNDVAGLERVTCGRK
ncbi:peptide chain release factor N(5)-glutamine methyltransferase [Gammaproteobacteria bacterium]|nr:peptide chain release factor N(5)-glutamine methyltransferase [Gammaproteobacteria bacterium]